MKGLEALERLRNTLLAEGYWQDILQDVSIIEKELKALEIIKNKKVDVGLFICCGCLEGYNKCVSTENKFTQEEYDLLEEVLL